MPPPRQDSAFIEAKASALDTLSQLTSGKLGVLQAAHKLSSLRHTLIGDVRDEDWDTFVGIDSETDHLPLLEHRKNWAPEALKLKDIEIKGAEDFFRPRAMEAANNLLRRYEEHT